MTLERPLVTRNAIMDALASLFRETKKFKSVQRKFIQNFQESMSASMPMACITKPIETYPARDTKQLPPKRTFMCEVFVWLAFGQDQKAVPDRELCDIMDAIDSVMRPVPPQQTQTLGGLVDLCYIEGDVDCIPGDVDGLGLIKIPIKIIVP